MHAVSRFLASLLLALAALVPTGCLGLAVVGAAAGAGAAGYVYYNGLLYRDYNANLGDSVAAVRSALAELQLPLIEEKPDTASVAIRSKTGDGHAIRVHLNVVPNPIPAEPPATRIGVRIGFSGDDVVSARILDQVSRHLTSPAALPPTPASVAPALGPPQPVQTPAPPLVNPTERLVPIAATSPG